MTQKKSERRQSSSRPSYGKGDKGGERRCHGKSLIV
jgi:hypothetical protein